MQAEAAPAVSLKKEADAITGGLSAPSKMPGHAYSLPARECLTGSRLRGVANSVCAGCYAMKNRYTFNNVQRAMYRRLAALSHPLWSEAMAFLINRTGDRFFRWHDSGDLQSVVHLARIAEVCERTPSVRHWLPTREYSIVSDYRARGGAIPRNLTIRLSAHIVDGPLPKAMAKRLGCAVSGVSTNGEANCPAPTQGNSCADCRACWDKRRVVIYRKH